MKYSDLKTLIADYARNTELSALQINNIIEMMHSKVASKVRHPLLLKTDSAFGYVSPVALPSDFVEAKSLSYGNRTYNKVTLLEFDRTRRGLSVSWRFGRRGAWPRRQPYYAVDESSVLLSADASEPGEFRYYYQPTLPTNENTALPLFVRFPGLCLAASAEQTFAFLQNEERAAYWAAKTDNEIDEANAQGRRTDAGD